MKSSSRKLQILLLCDRPAKDAGTILDHIDSFSRYSRHQVFTLSLRGFIPLKLDLSRFDVLVIHYSIYILGHVYLGASAKQMIHDFRGLKVQFIQDEYRTVNAMMEEMRKLGIDVLFTCYPEEEIKKVYSETCLPRVRKVNNLTGYIQTDLLHYPVTPLKDRPIDVGYRARKVPLWLGKLGAEKWQIVPRFLEAVQGEGLISDLSYQEHDRLYGGTWIRFLDSSKAVLGTESGASVIDFTGEIQSAVEAHLRKHPDAGFEEIEEKFLKPHEGKIRMNQISPRCFEAMALKTAMILYDGEYSGILKPWRHFIPLRKDFSNIKEVVLHLKDTERLQEMVDRTYQEIALIPLYSYERFVSVFDSVVEKEMEERKKQPAHPCYDASSFRSAAEIDFRKKGTATFRIDAVRKNILGLPYLFLLLWRIIPYPIRQIFRALFKKFVSLLSRRLKNLLVWVYWQFKAGSASAKNAALCVLILYWDDWHYPLRPAVKDHLNAVRVRFPEHQCYFHNVKFSLPKFLKGRRFDGVVLHNTLLCLRWCTKEKAKWGELASDIATIQGVKIAIPQDEYDHAHVLDEFLERAGVTVIFSNFDETHRSVLYPRMSRKAEFQKVFTGYLSDSFVKTADRLSRPLSERKMDLGYRALRLPYWFGRWGQMKSAIARPFKKTARALSLFSDVSSERRDAIYGKKWIRFLASSKAVIGCEGGSSLLDPKGEIQERVRAYLAKNPHARFSEVKNACFAGKDGRYLFQALSPRHLEAAATRTVQILIEGDYDGVLTPLRHYIPVKRDLSNLRQALERLRDIPFCQSMVQTAYRDIVDSGKYSTDAFAEQVILTLKRLQELGLDFQTGKRVNVWVSIRYSLFRLMTAGVKLFLAPAYTFGRFLIHLKRPCADSRGFSLDPESNLFEWAGDVTERVEEKQCAE